MVVYDQNFFARETREAVPYVISYLEEDASSSAYKTIYFDGWSGLGASAVLRRIAQDPPRSLLSKFDKIIHVDCSRWKSRRSLQRAIAEEIKLSEQVMAIFDSQDEEDDFSGVPEGSRDEIGDVGREILRVLMEYRCLVVFHNGSNGMIDLISIGIPQPELFGTKILWTFRGRLQLVEIPEEAKMSHLVIYSRFSYGPNWEILLQEEAREIAQCTCRLAFTPEVAEECCLYLLSLNSKGGNIIDYNWVTHASNYWVCDEIIKGGQYDEAWEVAAALHQQLRLEGYSSSTLPSFGDTLETPPNRWIFAFYKSNSGQMRETNMVQTVPPESTSYFLSMQRGCIASLPDDMFLHSDKLRVVKLHQCSFSFSSPPFHFCRNLRFLGLDGCKDQQQKEEKQDREAMDFFGSLWVLDICSTDWEMDLSPKILKKMATNIRELHIKNGRIWRSNFAWRQLQNLRKLRVIMPTCPWETGEMDEFIDMVKLELVDLSGNSTLQVLPSLSGAVGLKTLILDGCVGLERVGPEGLPPSLESFSLDAGVKEEAEIRLISMVGCPRLSDFTLRGSLPKLEELYLSSTSIKTVDLKDQVVQVPCLQRMILVGCLQLHAILWPKDGLPKLTVLCIDPLVSHVLADHHQSYVTTMDIRFFQSLVLESKDKFGWNNKFCWNNDAFHLNCCVPSTTKDKGQSWNKDKRGSDSTLQVTGPPLLKSLVPSAYCCYTDIATDKLIIDDDSSSALQFEPSHCHVEIDEGFSYTNIVPSERLVKAIMFVMDMAESLHVHDNSSITTIIPEYLAVFTSPARLRRRIIWSSMKQCRVERCPKLHTVFTNDSVYLNFKHLESFWAVDLQMAHCIWSNGRVRADIYTDSFTRLRSMYLYSCPRLTFVLPLTWFYLGSLEILHIIYCGDLRQVFPVEAQFLEKIATDHSKGILEFPKLKHIYLHDLPKLQQICEAKMFAPKLETVKLRGCWGLKRLPSVNRHGTDNRPIVDCEKDWWEELVWDGLEAGHHPCLFEPRHSRYYKKALPRVSVLR